MNERNAELANAVLDLALKWGVREFVVCAGARNAPLVLSLLDPVVGVRVWNHFDERAAGFFALGLAKRKRMPTAVVTTSGTAAAELLPAVIEAYYSGIPLVVITADRPKRFRGTGAPQSIEQAGIFGPFVEASVDLEISSDFASVDEWSHWRPVHLNPCFEEPGEGALASPQSLRETRDSASFSPNRGSPETAAAQAALLQGFVADFSDGLVILGEIDAGERRKVEEFLVRLHAPVWADASSGLRESRDLPVLRNGERAILRWPPAKVLRIGGVPSLRFWRDLEERPDVPVLSVTPTGFPGLARRSETMGWPDFSGIQAAPTRMPMSSLPDLVPLFKRFPCSEPALIHWLSRKIPSSARVFLGNSLPIREWNLAATFEKPHPDCFVSRGANGIDGGISTFLGLSEGIGESWAILGDLTTLYDFNAPWMADRMTKGKRRLVVINNGGGRIFSRLPALQHLSENAKVITENRHGIDFEKWAGFWHWSYRKMEHFAEFDDPKRAHAVIEVRPDPEQTDRFWDAFEAH